MLNAWTNPVYTFARATGMMGRTVKGKAWLHLNNLLLVRRLSSGSLSSNRYRICKIQRLWGRLPRRRILLLQDRTTFNARRG